jgi:hypothetical protein
MAARAFAVEERVRCLATRFDKDSEDRNGDVFSVRHRRAGNGDYCYGTVRWVYSSRRGPAKYRVFYGGDATQMQSVEDHLERAVQEEEPVTAEPVESHVDDENDEVDEVHVDADSTDSEGEKPLNMDG